MKKTLLLGAVALLASATASVSAQNTPVSQMEKLDRGLVAVPAKSGKGYFVSWRLLGTDDVNTTFTLLRNSATGTTAVKKDISEKTSHVDAYGNAASTYQVVTLYKGEPVDTTKAVSPWANIYKSIPLDRPAKGANGGTYSPNDCSVGDVDGDGQYEIILKWDPSNAQDNSHSNGPTDNVILDCYELDGTKLWRIDLGPNIRAGAHYTQFLVWDFDGDGKAELICKTAPGSKDGDGKYVTEAADNTTIKGLNNTTKLANSGGHILKGAELLTVFNGEGKAVHTIWYNPNRAGGLNAASTMPSSDYWGDNYGNRSERYLATVAYLQGADKNPSAVMVRGYYTRAFLWAVDYEGGKLKQRWLHHSETTSQYCVYDADNNRKAYAGKKPTRGSGSRTAYGNGNHNMACADVDGDGCDEIIWGACAIDHDGMLMYSTGYGNGDAMHVSDLDPTRPGLEVFTVHESSPYGCDVHDAATGEILFSATADGDTGRGLSADIDASSEGFEFWHSGDRNPRSAVTGKTVNNSNPSVNFRMYWDGDLQDEILDGNSLKKWSGTGLSGSLVNGKDFYDYASSSTCNSTKKTPNLLADILGDWREELILWDGSNSAALNIFTTNEPTDFLLPTLMHDHTYRLAVAWQNGAYNQPPHLGYYLPYAFKTELVMVGESDWEQTVNVNDSIAEIVIKNKNATSAPDVVKVIMPDGTTYEDYQATTSSTFTAMGLKRSKSSTKKSLTITGAPKEIGTYTIIVESGPNSVDKTKVQDTIIIKSVDPTAIEEIVPTTETALMSVYTVDGIRVCSKSVRLVNGLADDNALNGVKQGVYIVRFKTADREWSTKITKE